MRRLRGGRRRCSSAAAHQDVPDDHDRDHDHQGRRDNAAKARSWFAKTCLHGSGDVRHDRGLALPGPDGRCFRLLGAGRNDHAPCVVEPAFDQFEAEQALALERARQRQFAGPGTGEAEARVIRRVAEQNDRAMATRLPPPRARGPSARPRPRTSGRMPPPPAGRA